MQNNMHCDKRKFTIMLLSETEGPSNSNRHRIPFDENASIVITFSYEPVKDVNDDIS